MSSISLLHQLRAPPHSTRPERLDGAFQGVAVLKLKRGRKSPEWHSPFVHNVNSVHITTVNKAKRQDDRDVFNYHQWIWKSRITRFISPKFVKQNNSNQSGVSPPLFMSFDAFDKRLHTQKKAVFPSISGGHNSELHSWLQSAWNEMWKISETFATLPEPERCWRSFVGKIWGGFFWCWLAV